MRRKRTRFRKARAVGRPSAYCAAYAELALNYCLLGATDAELGEFFGVSEQTVNAWKVKHPQFLESIKKGKCQADAAVARSLHDQALEGNTTAQIFWLKNRQPQKWRDKIDYTHQNPDGSGLLDSLVLAIARETAGTKGAKGTP